MISVLKHTPTPGLQLLTSSQALFHGATAWPRHAQGVKLLKAVFKFWATAKVRAVSAQAVFCTPCYPWSIAVITPPW